MQWETVIGLEIHAQLATQSKMFSGAPTRYGAEPNTQACAIDLGLPGVLPVINAEAVRMAVRFGLAIDASIAARSVFERKNYFYPDLPKGYQISQLAAPIVANGRVRIESGAITKVITIIRAHLEEDAGKSLHEDFHGMTGIDLNRAGTPLLEIVSAPELSNAAEAVAYARAIHTLVRYLGICDGNMQEGSFRCDANVSLRPYGTTALGTRTEVKNLNSFRFLEQAIEYEVGRQADVLESGGTVRQETRLYDPERAETRPLRAKEEANDYRYFPDPDLLPVVLDAAYIARARETLPELPAAKRARLREDYGLAAEQAEILVASPELADYFDAAARIAGAEPRMVANWVVTELGGALNRSGLALGSSPVAAAQLGALVRRIADGTISGRIAKQVFDAMWNGAGTADEVIDAQGLRQVSDSAELTALVDAVLAENQDQIHQYRAGKTRVLGFLVGQVIKRSGGKANPQAVNRLVKARLDA
jgi:aspartyl-tRNA(Asn)/glutamyl-tRNA(Gln) amidotransferase subunit B